MTVVGSALVEGVTITVVVTVWTCEGIGTFATLTTFVAVVEVSLLLPGDMPGVTVATGRLVMVVEVPT